MTVVSSKEFVTNENKYFKLARNEQVFVEKDETMFIVTIASGAKKKKYLAPDDDLRRAITADELVERIYEDIDKKFANRI